MYIPFTSTEKLRDKETKILPFLQTYAVILVKAKVICNALLH